MQVRQFFKEWEPVITAVSAVFGVGLYFYEIPDREEARQTLAWQLLALQNNRAGNGGQLWAIEVLAHDQVNMHGIHVLRADLSADYESGSPDPSQPTSPPLNPPLSTDVKGADLQGAKLNWSVFSLSNLGKSDLSHSRLRYAEFKCSVLRDVNFSNSDLEHADLRNAEISGANFTGANVAGIKFDDATCVMPGREQPTGLDGYQPFHACRPLWKDGFQPCNIPDLEAHGS